MRRMNWMGLLILTCAAVSGCAPKIDVSSSGSVPAQYSHVFVTVREVWFNSSATAGPDDTSWLKFTLTAPVTIDLVAAIEGTLAPMATGLAVPAGTYRQIRLLPVDSSSALVSSAQTLGALFNSEVDFVDGSGVLHQTPLELQNPDKGIGIATTLAIANDVKAVIATSSIGTTTNTSNSTGSPATGTTTTVTTPPGTTMGTTTAASSGTTTPTPVSLAINVNAARDLVKFTYTGLTGVLLNPHVTAFDTSTVGAIGGTLTLTGLTGLATTNGLVNIQVTAESLSADGSRHVAVNSAPVRSDGTFVLYPLNTGASSAATYDLVIHGPGLATVIVKSVAVSAGDPTTTTPVSIGTVVPRTAQTFAVNLTPGTSIPAGELIGFYQTLPGSGEVPYLVEEPPIDPFNRTFASDQTLSAGTIDYGTFASGADVALTTATPIEGVSTYAVSASAPLFADGTLVTRIAGQAGATTAVLVTPPVLSVAAGAVANSLTLTVRQTTPGRFDKGELIISHDGAIVATAALDTILTGGGTGAMTFFGLPGGSFASTFPEAIYYLSVRAWNTGDPAGTLHRQTFSNAVILNSGSVTGVLVTID